MKKLIQRIIKYRAAFITTVFVDKIICYEWILFGKFKVCRTFKTL